MVHDFKVIEDEKELFIAMSSKKAAEEEQKLFFCCFVCLRKGEGNCSRFLWYTSSAPLISHYIRENCRRYSVSGKKAEREKMDSNWYLIVGLGNPGKEYDGSRHNVGFEVADLLIDEFHIDGPTRFKKSLIGKGQIGDAKVVVMKPMTYMNLSGEAVREGLDYYKIDPATHLIVISDDIDLEPGHLRLRQKGSAGGHNGLKNIMQHVGDGNFIRVRIGVGAKPNPQYNLADHVLGHPKGEDKEKIDEAKERAVRAIQAILEEGIQKAMNHYN